MVQSPLRPRVHLYVTRTCGYCRAAKRLLTERGVPFVEFDISDDHDARMELVRKYHWRTVPVILAGEDSDQMDLIGGFTELAAMDRQSGLDQLRPTQEK